MSKDVKTTRFSVSNPQVFPLKILNAVSECLNRYRNTLSNPTHASISKWRNYGGTTSCLICKAVGRTEFDKYKPVNCPKCPLRSSANNKPGSAPCSSHTERGGIMGKTHHNLRIAIARYIHSDFRVADPTLKADVMVAMRLRLNALIRRLSENGLRVKEINSKPNSRSRK